MFEVTHKASRKHYIVYDIQYDASGYPHFLIYKDDQWTRMSAKHFQPTLEFVLEDTTNEENEDGEPDGANFITTPKENIAMSHVLDKQAQIIHNIDMDSICVACGTPLPEGDGMVCQTCLKNRGPKRIIKNLHIENSYNIWSTSKMFDIITEECRETYGIYEADKVLNRTYRSMYFEWWLHNIGYWLVLPLSIFKKIKALRERFKHVDLEDHRKNISIKNK